MKTKKLTFILLVFLSISLSAQTDSLLNKAPKLYPAWTFLVPGATHFYNHRIGEGLFFSATEISTITLGIIYDKKLASGNSTPYYNYPLLIGSELYSIDKCDGFINLMEYTKFKHPDLKYDPVSFNDLLKTPFQPENVFTPITGGLVALAIAELFLEGNKTSHSFKDINQMQFMNHYINRNPAMAFFGATSLLASYGAGISEEYVFRNYLMPILDYKFGPKKGLIYSSLAFGAMHATNAFMSDNPDWKYTILQVTEATIIGYVLGKDVQNRNYKIGPAVAAHMWYDFTLMLGSFLINPENNFLGVRMKFTIQ